MEDLPLIKVIAINELPDGGATIDFDVSEDFIRWYKKSHNVKRFTKKMFQRFFEDAIRGADGLKVRQAAPVDSAG